MVCILGFRRDGTSSGFGLGVGWRLGVRLLWSDIGQSETACRASGDTRPASSRRYAVLGRGHTPPPPARACPPKRLGEEDCSNCSDCSDCRAYTPKGDAAVGVALALRWRWRGMAVSSERRGQAGWRIGGVGWWWRLATNALRSFSPRALTAKLPLSAGQGFFSSSPLFVGLPNLPFRKGVSRGTACSRFSSPGASLWWTSPASILPSVRFDSAPTPTPRAQLW